eukprot:jgi/Astpho2/4524/Aster-x0650
MQPTLDAGPPETPDGGLQTSFADFAVDVKDTSTGRSLAVKALSLRSMSGWKQLDLFEREAKTLQGLSHPGIPAYVDYFETDLQQDKGFFLAQARH